MGAPKQKWTEEEEQALRAGVVKHGAGKWRTIQKDPEFNSVLASRSNIDLKDKWRNLHFTTGGTGSRERAKTPKVKDPSTGQSSSLPNISQVAVRETAGASSSREAAKGFRDIKMNHRYGTMILEALSALRDPNGTDIDVMCTYLEQRHETPNSFKRIITTKLRRLLAQKKVEKVGNHSYRIREFTSKIGTKIPGLKQKDPPNQASLMQNSSLFLSSPQLEEASALAACRIADAEAKSYAASEAVKEAERVCKMSEESQSLLQMAEEILEQCMRGEVVTISLAA